jgi:cytosine/adenosine deaminase-related metal-dependent hydrolase
VDLVVRNARLSDGRLVDLGAEGGRWTRVGGPIATDGAREIDAAGRLVTPPLVDCHLHLDASLTAGKPRWNESGTLIEGIQVWGELKPTLTEQDVFERAYEIVRWSVAQGTLFIRAHADVSGENEAMARGLLRLRDEVAELCTVQVTAFPQDGISRATATRSGWRTRSGSGSTASAGSRTTSRPRSSACERCTACSSSPSSIHGGSTCTATRQTIRAAASSK